MPFESFTLLIALAIGITILILMVIRAKKFKEKSNDIEIGMSISQVESILGKPKNIKYSGNIMTCIWTIHGVPSFGFVSYKSLTCVIVFEDERVKSVINS